MKPTSIQVCGTGSGVGKSVIVAALCRIFKQDGYKTAPFKAQNMALNSYVTLDGGEMGRAQVFQAQACGIEPAVDMNPILIKPSSDTGAQVIVLGKPVGNMSARRYIKSKKEYGIIAKRSLKNLLDEYEIVVMEGAGSPAEINLRSHDIVNIKMAIYAKAPVILVGDIDKGGVFAWIIGTLDLLTKQERKMVKGIIINKFRGDKTLLKPGIGFLQKHTGIKVLGVIPYFKGIRIPEEDAVPLDSFHNEKRVSADKLNIAVVYLPHISNFTDFDVLQEEEDVELRYVKNPDELNAADMIIIPGTKNTISDLQYLKKYGFTKKIRSIIATKNNVMLAGLCGGYQMLGNKIYDKQHVESSYKEIEGLGFLPVETYLKKDKLLAQVKAKDVFFGKEVSGYEIHHGYAKCKGEYGHAFEISQRNGKPAKCLDGAMTPDKRIWGTYIHGVFDTGGFRRDLLNLLRKKKGWPAITGKGALNLEDEYDKLASVVRNNLDIKQLYKIIQKV